MHAFRFYISLLLLLCLTRTLVPEAWILALHTHGHTTDEPAQRGTARQKGQALLSPKHQHCQVDHVYNLPFLPGAPVVVPVPTTRLSFATAPVPTTATAPWIARPVAQLRGPPAA